MNNRDQRGTLGHISNVTLPKRHDFFRRAMLVGLLLFSCWLSCRAQTCTTKPPGATFDNPIVVNLIPGVAYSDTQSNDPANCFGSETQHFATDDICYKFTMANAGTVRLSNIGSNFSCGIGVGTVINGVQTIIALAAKDTLVNGTYIAQNPLKVDLAPGTYFVVSVGLRTDIGNIVTNISVDLPRIGSNRDRPVDIGTLSAGGSYSNGTDNSPASKYYNDYGQASDDVYYKFTLNAKTKVSVALFGFDTFLTLLDAEGNVVDYNDDYGPLSTTGTTASMAQNLMPGTYYIVAEGKDSNCGSMTLQVTAAVPAPERAINNYESTNLIRDEGVRTSSAADTTTISSSSRQIIYFDGLGRPLQQVNVQASPTKRDVVTPMAYDQFGREPVKYLPFVATSANSNGMFKPNALADQLSFYSNPSGSAWNAPGVDTTSYPFSKTVFEPSPRSLIIEQGSPGGSWQPAVVRNVTGGRTMLTCYSGNTAEGGSRAVRLFTADGTGITRQLSAHGWYPKDSLTVKILKDENWTSSALKAGTVEEYKDKEGRVVLKRQWFDDNTPLSTYYVYDDLGNLSFVLPPGINPDAGTVDQAGLNIWAYQYRYDGRHRQVQKKLPGRGWQFIIYNQLDQVIFTQDANQRNKTPQEWTFNRYDKKGRLVITGIYLSSDNADASDSPGQNRFQSLTGFSTMHQPIWASRDNSTTTGYNADSPTGTPLTINYYDDYSAPQLPVSYLPPAGSIKASSLGLPTASKKAILNADGSISNAMLWNVFYYDGFGRVSKSYTQHFLGGVQGENNYDDVVYSYNFAGQVTSTVRQHHTVASNGSIILRIAESDEFDHEGRKLRKTEQLNGDPKVMLSSYRYNEIGQLYQKGLHDDNYGGSVPANAVLASADAMTTGQRTVTATTSITLVEGFSVSAGATFVAKISAPSEIITYSYNARGWIKSKKTDDNLLNLHLDYNSGPQAQFNGNISSMSYNTTKVSHPGTRLFHYSYDKLNRLTLANFSGGAAEDALSESVSYDLMGNITQIVRGGVQGGTLNFTSYTGNLLNTVTGYSARNYLYDANGNAKSDGMGKGIFYNTFNLPRVVTQPGSANVLSQYIYDSGGTKLQNSGSDGVWEYINGIVYHTLPGITTRTIAFVITEEGRADRQTDGSYRYQYNLQDHLGNNRVSFDVYNNAVRVVQEDEYYSFGLRKPIGTFDLSNNNRFLYTGKEIQSDLVNQYDCGARFFDPLIARWTTTDPLAEKFSSLSPYTYTFNDPIKHNDPDGRSGEVTIDKANGVITIHSRLVFYGGSATTENSARIAGSIAQQWNAANGSVIFNDGHTYKVQFKISYMTVDEETARAAAEDDNTLNNFIRVEDVQRSSFFAIEGNSGFFNINDFQAGSTTGSHEYGHSLGEDHPQKPDGSVDIRGQGQPWIMVPRNSVVDSRYQINKKAKPGPPNGTVNPNIRKVTQKDIDNLKLQNLDYDENGHANIGKANHTTYDKNGNKILD